MSIDKTYFAVVGNEMIAESGASPEAAIAATEKVGISRCDIEVFEATKRFSVYIEHHGIHRLSWLIDAAGRIDLYRDQDRREAALLEFEEQMRARLAADDLDGLLEFDGLEVTFDADVDEDNADDRSYSVYLGHGDGSHHLAQLSGADDDAKLESALAAVRETADDGWDVDVEQILRERCVEI